MGGGFSLHNETDVEVIVVLSQAGPLHWLRVPPRSSRPIHCGAVWFTMTARLWDGQEPGIWHVAKPFVIGVSGAIAVTSVIATGGIAIAAYSGAGTAVLAGSAVAGTAAVAGLTAAAAAETAVVVTAAGTSASVATAANFAGAVTGLVVGVASSAVTVGAALTRNADSKLQKAVSELHEKWLAVIPSQESAQWLAKHQVICVEPVWERGHYAVWPDIHICHKMLTSQGVNRMQLTLAYK